jgi:SAM-dependent methyltransferase
VLMVHSLEFAENPRETMKELWRVLAPGGRLVIVVPNRRGVWARMEHTPFGSGRPYSRSQLTALLRETNFTPGASAEALFFPPSKLRSVQKLRGAFERLGRMLWPMFSGVIIVEAQKRLYQGLPVAARASRRVFVPVLAPRGVPSTRSRATKAP